MSKTSVTTPTVVLEPVASGELRPAAAELVAKPRVGVPFKKGDDERRQNGRVKGSKNRVTFLRLELEEALRNKLTRDGIKIYNKAVKMALSGNDKVMKVLLDKMLASPKGDDPENAKDTDVRIVIQNLTHGEQKTAVITQEKSP